VTGTIFRVARASVHDGPGLRTTIFLKGCPLRCQWCHSPESQQPRPQLAVHDERCLVCGTCLPGCEHGAIEEEEKGYHTDFGRCRACGACVARCPSGARELVGRVVGVDELLKEIERDVVFFDESGGGVTFSGGEPLMQPAFLEAMLTACRARGLHTAVDTCGMAEPATFARVAPLADLFLFDVKVIDDRWHRHVTGASNHAILANLRWLCAEHRRVRVRFPLVPGLTDVGGNVERVGQLLASLGVQDLDLLPYHRAGLAKYDRLGFATAPTTLPVPSAADVDRAAQVLRDCGLAVQVGG
jgi:pyruvate formate lyase activating enzyme